MTIHCTYECDVCHKEYKENEVVSISDKHICRDCMKIRIWDYARKVYGTGINDLEINTVKWMYISLKNIVSAIGNNAIIMEPSSSQMDEISKECQPKITMYRYAVDFYYISELTSFIKNYCQTGMYRIVVNSNIHGKPQLYIDLPKLIKDNDQACKYSKSYFTYQMSYEIER